MSNVTPKEIEIAIRNVSDFPKPGIQFKDITPVLADPRLFAGTIDLLTANYAPARWTPLWALMRADLFLPPPPR